MNLSLEIALLCLAMSSGLVILMLVTDGEGPYRRRIKQLRDGRQGDSRKPSNAAATSIAAQRSKTPTLDRLFKRFVPHPDMLRQRLARAGLKLSLGLYGLISALSGLAVSLLVWLALEPPLAALIPVAVVGAFGLPHLVVGFRIVQRKKAFIAQFPEAIELIVRGIKAGLPVSESMRTVAEEIQAPVGPAFGRIVDAGALGRSTEETLQLAAKEIDLPEFNFFVVAISIQRDTGGNLSEALTNLTALLRRRRQVKLKIKALSAEARTGAIIVGMLPFLVGGALYFLNKGYILRLLEDPRGHVMLVFAGSMLLFGLGVMARMVRFEI
jgi:tight adherence protein B